MTETAARTTGGSYDFQRIERRWREYWVAEGTYRTAGPGEEGFDPKKPRCYILDMFPYPSGEGLHIGHPKGYIASDIYSRFKRMSGYNVLHPMGFDSFGLPAEQYAIEHNVHPAVSTDRCIDRYRAQLQYLGLGYDWDREIATSHEDYYRWTQWIFVQLFDSWYDPQLEWRDRSGRSIRGRGPADPGTGGSLRGRLARAVGPGPPGPDGRPARPLGGRLAGPLGGSAPGGPETTIAWPTRRRSPSTGVPASARCSPTRR